MEDVHSPPPARKRTCISASKRSAAECHHRSREAPLLLNNTSISPQPTMRGSLPSATMTKDHLYLRQEQAVLDANEEENEYRSLRMMGTGGNTSKQSSLKPGQGMMNSRRDTMHPYNVPSAETPAGDDLRGIICRAPPPRISRTSHEQEEVTTILKPCDPIFPSSDSCSNIMTEQQGTKCFVDAQRKPRSPNSFETPKLSDFSLAPEALSSPEPACNLVGSRTSVEREQIDSPSTERYQSDDSSCTLRNETSEAEKESQALTRPVELVEWVPSQKCMKDLAMYDTHPDIGTSSKNHKEKARGRPVDNFGMSKKHQPIWGGLLETFSKKRKQSSVDQETEEPEDIAETSDPKRQRLPHHSPQLESIPETPSTSHTMNSQSSRTEVPSSDIDDMSSISGVEEASVKPKRVRTMKKAPMKNLSLNQFSELPQLSEKNLTEILRARYSASTTPTRNIQPALRNSTSSTLSTNTPSTLGRSFAYNCPLTSGSFSDDERFEASFRSAFDE